MTITAKYASQCATCQRAITPGQQIEWAKGQPVRHAACVGQPVASVVPSAPRVGSYATIGARTRARQRATGWTGCACGSIEGQPRRSDCFSCRHDAD